jgi:hypothetical protein
MSQKEEVMSSASASQYEAMRKEVLEKPDGRYLIYYSFPKSFAAQPAQAEPEQSPCKPCVNSFTQPNSSAVVAN